MSFASKQNINWVIFIVYSIAAGVVIWHHEMWRDELQAWGIASSANTLTELIHNARYEGHPMLWFILIWPLAKLGSNPVAIQVFHGCLAAATAYLIVFRSPFTLVEKVLILFSYYFIYEYVALSRNYQIGVLLICTICVLWRNPNKNLLEISVLLFFLVQTNVFACLVGFGLSVGLLVEEYYAKSLWPLKRKQLLAAFIILSGIGLTSFSLPPVDTVVWMGDPDWKTIFFASAGIAHGFLPITDFSVYQFWNYSFFPFGLAVKLILGLVLLALACISMPKDRTALIILCSTVLFIFVFTFLKPRGLLRHFGHYTLILLAAYWIQGNKRNTKQAGAFSIGYFGILILSIQVLAGMNAWYRDVKYPFSMAKDVAFYIQKNYPETTAVAGVFQDKLTALRWYLQRPIYDLDIQRYGTYVIFNQSNWNDTLNTQPDSVTYVRYIAFQKTHTPSLLIMSYHAVRPSGHNPQEGEVDTLRTAEGNYLFRCVKKFDGSITDEEFYLFDVKK